MIGSAGLSGAFGPGQAARLEPVLGVGERVLVRDLRQAERLHADADARARSSSRTSRAGPVRLRRPASRARRRGSSRRWRCRGCPSSPRCAPHLMPLRSPRLPSAFGHELGHDEQRDALGARRRVRQARQHQVDDVLRQVVLAGRDEDLGAGDAVAAVGLRLGLGCAACRGRCRSAASVRHMVPVHSPGDQLRQVQRLLLVGAVLAQAVVGAVGQARDTSSRPGWPSSSFPGTRCRRACGRPWPP